MSNITKSKALTLPQNCLPIGSTEAYVAWANKFPFLTASEEKELGIRFREQGDLEAAQKLVLSHLRLVIHISRKYLGYGLAFGDLIQEGTMGLMKAVKNFDPHQGFRLVSFAIHWIKAEIHEFILKNYRIVKVATTKAQRKLFFNLRKMTRDILDKQTLSSKQSANIAETLNVSTKDVKTMEMRLNGQDIAFETSSNDSEEFNYNPINYLAAPQNLEPALLIEQEDLAETNGNALTSALTGLDKRSQEIIKARWLSGKKSTLKELAKKYGVSMERVRQIENNALKKMKGALEGA